MAEVTPFQGYRYNPSRIDNMAAVMAPPYDVISPAQQTALYQRHPHNVVRLILGHHEEGDNQSVNAHSRARDHLRQWIEKQILVRDDRPSFYLTELSFAMGDHTVVRHGLVGAVGLRPFSDGIILPHEHTFSKVKSERLSLLKATKANLCSIFGLFPDEHRQMVALMKDLAQERSADMDLVDDDDFRHRLWCISDPQVQQRISQFFSSQKLYIADGHHRYETALNYRNWLRDNTADFSATHPTNYVMMSLCSMQDNGLVVLPAHRLLHQVPGSSLAAFKERAASYFDILPMDAAGDKAAAMARLQTTMAQNSHRSAVGFVTSDPDLIWILLPKEGMMDQLFGQDIPAALRELDVTVATELILMKLLGFDQAALDDEHRITYNTSAHQAAEAVKTGSADAALILNATKIEQVKKVAEAGLTMPRKSTYFFPKIISGQVFNVFP